MATRKRISVTLSLLMWTLMVLIILGAISALLGVGGTTSLDLEFNDLKIGTSSVGLGIMAIAAYSLAFVVARLPKGVELFGDAKPTLTERIVNLTSTPWLVLGLISTAVLVAALFL